MGKSQYKNSGEWRKACPKDYQTAYSQGFLDKICEEMGWDKPNTNRKPNGYWNIKENVLTNAKKYDSTSKWDKGSSSAYASAKKHGWFEEATAHMKKYHKPDGYWNIKENVLAEARKYNTLAEWRKHGGSSPACAKKYGWFEEAIAHMELVNIPNGYWKIKENVISNALKFDDLSKWRGKHRNAYTSAKDNGWIDECTAHMALPKQKENGYWTKEKCLDKAKKYNNRQEWKKHDGGSFSAAYKQGWFDECVKHMKKHVTYWTKELCIKEALKYKIKGEWRDKHNKSYNAAYLKGWLEECTEHMEESQKPTGYWTKERCHEEALKHKTKSSFKLSKPSTAYNKAIRNGWFEEICSHMKKRK